jgi:DNA-binding NarL/FixJ family response regulator
VRVVIGEDLFLLRDGLVRLLEAHGFEVVAAVGSAPELLKALTELKPDVGIVDVRLPPTFTDDGLRVAIEARRRCPGLPLLVLSQYVEQLYARELLADQAGGVGYLLKDRVFSDDAFADAVRGVAAGGTVLDPEVVSRLLAKRTRSGPLAELTPREREVLSLMAEGRSNAAIGARLFITEKAVSKHAAGIFAKLGLAPSDDDNRRVLAVLAYLSGYPPARRLGWCRAEAGPRRGACRSLKLLGCRNVLSGMSPSSVPGRPGWPPRVPPPPRARGRSCSSGPSTPATRPAAAA